MIEAATLRALTPFFDSPEQMEEKKDLPVLQALIRRYREEQPFRDCRVVFGHVLVRNALVMVEALCRGGAQVVLSRAHPSPAERPCLEALEALGLKVWPVAQAVALGDLYLDVAAVLGRQRPPRAAAEVTRTGVRYYRDIPCPVVSADDCLAKRIEGYFGTGDAFLRAWRLLRPKDPLGGKRAVLFGYGKIGRGVARAAREAGMQVVVAEVDPTARARASVEGFETVAGTPNQALRRALARAQVVIAVTGVPGVLGCTLPPEWLRANRPVLVNLGAEDEFGPAFEEHEILGGRQVPLNFHLPQPTLNRYVDPALAAHLLALEAWVRAPGRFPPGIHPLPEAMDRWILETWQAAWPEEDLTPILKPGPGV